jgi:hypothetical protein
MRFGYSVTDVNASLKISMSSLKRVVKKMFLFCSIAKALLHRCKQAWVQFQHGSGGSASTARMALRKLRLLSKAAVEVQFGRPRDLEKASLKRQQAHGT